MFLSTMRCTPLARTFRSHAIRGGPVLFMGNRANVVRTVLTSGGQNSTRQKSCVSCSPDQSKSLTSLMPAATAWEHPVYSDKQVCAITISHRDVKDWTDKVALNSVRLLRWGMDFATGYKHPTEEQARKHPHKFVMTEEKWLTRFIFLESVAGVPGMVGGMLRHLRSLRKMKRDNGWIETLLEEAHNERMHLLTFLKLAKPGWFMRLMVIGAQGVFFNGFFLAYLISPRICHRFVGYLEEEAVITYTRAIQDLEHGKLPKWQTLQSPDIAIKYWKMPEGRRSMRDLLLYVRADEAKHREVNHTFGNLVPEEDPNPFAGRYSDTSKLQPSKGLMNLKPIGWERKDVL
nr:mitochondrial alternative oxidase [Trichoderma asperellum]